MRAVVSAGIGQVEVADVPDPVIIDPDDAIIQVTRTAICGSDLHLVQGKLPIEPGEGIGHEALGEVVAAGPDAGVEIGDRVAASFIIGCGHCWFCTHDASSMCEDLQILGYGIFGGSLGGAQSELLRVPHAWFNLLDVPASIDDERGVFVGDIGATAIYGAGRAEIVPGDTVTVVGAGPLGLLTAQAAMLDDPEQVIILERDPERLAMAATIGAVAVDVGEHHPVMALAEHTQGRGADVVIEAVGTQTSFEVSLDLARRGGRVVVLGVFASETIDFQLGAQWIRSLDVRFAGLTPVHAWWERTRDVLASGRLDPTSIISHRLPLEDAAVGYDLFGSRAASKVILSP